MTLIRCMKKVLGLIKGLFQTQGRWVFQSQWWQLALYLNLVMILTANLIFCLTANQNTVQLAVWHSQTWTLLQRFCWTMIKEDKQLLFYNTIFILTSTQSLCYKMLTMLMFKEILFLCFCDVCTRWQPIYTSVDIFFIFSNV